MNDVVFEYDLKVTECQAEKWFEAGQGYKEGLKLTLDIRAKGGRYPIKLGVVLGGLDKKYIETVATRILLKEGQGKETELATGEMKAEMPQQQLFGKSQFCKVTVDTEHGSPVIIMDGLSALGDNTNFFQTTKGFINPGQGMLRAEIILGAKVRTSLTEDLDQLKAYRALITDTHNQNFFIVTNTNKEIHMKGYRPSYLYTNYEADSAGEMMEGVPYCNKNGFVWGIKVPVGVKHAYEKVLFDDAYPEFRAWVTSNGVDNKDWYLHPAAEKVVEAW
ncbi:LruC domain-containing protein [Bacteroides ovatus]|nr:LruC domain-containing protein [Bacteroides ovatus]